MTKCRMGVLRFTFCDQETEMIVHLFRVNVTTKVYCQGRALVPIDPSVCDPVRRLCRSGGLAGMIYLSTICLRTILYG